MNKNFLQVWNILNQWSTFITLTIFLGKMDTGGLCLNYYWGARVLMFPGSNPAADAIMLFGFVVGSLLCTESFFWVTGLSPWLKNQRFQIPIRSGIREMKNHQVDVTSPHLSSQCHVRPSQAPPPLLISVCWNSFHILPWSPSCFCLYLFNRSPSGPFR